MPVIGIDIGGTKLASAVFLSDGAMEDKIIDEVGTRQGKEVGDLVIEHIRRLYDLHDGQIDSIGISVPGISYVKTGTVWAPNIPGWTEYPLIAEIRSALKPHSPGITVESDRACYILGETWLGNAKGCGHAIFMAVGTGIGAGIMINGQILRGSSDIAGCVGWMALNKTYIDDYKRCGCFEYNASGTGIAFAASNAVSSDKSYSGDLTGDISARDVFNAYDNGDSLAVRVINDCIVYWGMAVANLVSLFNPEIIVMGGGVFGPASQFCDRISAEAKKWAQPIGMTEVRIVSTALGDDAGLIGAARLALNIT